MLWSMVVPALAWETKQDENGNDVHWDSAEIAYSIHEDVPAQLDVDAVTAAIQSAAEAWTIPAATGHAPLPLFKASGDTKQQGASYTDGVHSVSFSNSWNNDPDLLAITYVWYNSDGELIHFDIEINADDHSWSTSPETATTGDYDLQNALAHEFGHALGLEHSEITDATMAPSAVDGETIKRDLHSDDIDGMKHLYSDLALQPNSGAESNPNQNEGGSGGGGATGGGETPEFEGPQSGSSSSGSQLVALDNAGGCSTASVQPGAGWLSLVLGLLWLRRKR